MGEGITSLHHLQFSIPQSMAPLCSNFLHILRRSLILFFELAWTFRIRFPFVYLISFMALNVRLQVYDLCPP
uniref:Uncharacterized protein n=1 Tax=Eptatretus burgeri TaxID=7764 RepID=A0A8C4X153_EPTBU